MSRGIGVYIGRKHVIAAEAARVAGTFRLQKYAVEPILESSAEETIDPTKPTSESNAVRAALEKIGAKGCFASASISPFHIVTRHFVMPALPVKERPDAIQFEASRFTRLKINESVCAYRENKSVGNAISVTASAVKKRTLQSLLINLRRGTIQPGAIEPDFIPFSRVCRYFNFAESKKPYAMIWMDGDLSVSVTLVSNEIVFFSQDFRLTGEMQSDRSKCYEELLGAFRFLSENAGKSNVENLFLAGFGNLDEWTEFLGQSFPQTKITVLRPPIKAETSPGTSEAVLAFGLALGDLGMDGLVGGGISLLPKEDKKLRPARFYSLLGGSAAAMIVLFFLAYFFVQTPILNLMTKNKNQAMAPLAVFGPSAEDALTDLEFRASAMEARFMQLEKFEKAVFPWRKTFVAVIKKMPKSFWLQSLKLENTQASRLVLQGYCFLGEADKEAKQVNAWAQEMAQDEVFSKRFPHLAVDEIKQEKFMGRNMTHFKVTAEA